MLPTLRLLSFLTQPTPLSCLLSAFLIAGIIALVARVVLWLLDRLCRCLDEAADQYQRDVQAGSGQPR